MQAIGLKTDVMDYHAAEQQNGNWCWCWAAYVQMVLSTRGGHVSQRDIVAKAFGGQLLDHGGTAADILANLECRMSENSGRRWRVQALLGRGPPTFELMKEQFERDMPLIVCYHLPGESVGYAVVVAAVIYESTEQGRRIVRVLIRDPWPEFGSSRGEREMAPAEFERISTYYLVIPSES